MDECREFMISKDLCLTLSCSIVFMNSFFTELARCYYDRIFMHHFFCKQENEKKKKVETVMFYSNSKNLTFPRGMIAFKNIIVT